MPVPDKMFVTADCATFAFDPELGLVVLLVRRANDPYKGLWALPGGFVDLDEDLQDAAERELKEETGIEADVVMQVGAFGTPGRDPRGRNVTICHLGATAHGPAAATGGDDAAEARWFPVDALPDLAFDHDNMLEAALEMLSSLVGNTHFGYLLLPDSFTAAQLERLVGALMPGDTDELDTLTFLAASDVSETTEPWQGDQAVFRCVADSYMDPLNEPHELLDNLAAAFEDAEWGEDTDWDEDDEEDED